MSAADELTGAEAKGAHKMLNEAEALARLLRIASGGHLSLAVVHEREGLTWHDAHEIISALARKGDEAP